MEEIKSYLMNNSHITFFEEKENEIIFIFMNNEFRMNMKNGIFQSSRYDVHGKNDDIIRILEHIEENISFLENHGITDNDNYKKMIWGNML